jgi:hypothetical protein
MNVPFGRTTTGFEGLDGMTLRRTSNMSLVSYGFAGGTEGGKEEDICVLFGWFQNPFSVG